MFIKYQHLERFGTSEVQDISLGVTYAFPKIDGTNGCVWINEHGIQAGSRNRKLTLDQDNAGFYRYILDDKRIENYLKKNPEHRLFGEWLVPHSLRTYRTEAWQKFYIFDVGTIKPESEMTHEMDSKINYLHFETYKPLLEEHGLDYIMPLAILRNGNYEQFINQLSKNVFLIEDGKGTGEGIVIKNYEYKNKFGRQTWAKIITSEFKEQHIKVMGANEIEGKKLIEEEITEKYCTNALVEKVFSKIQLEKGWQSKFIPELLNTVYYDVVKEESWNFVKEHKFPTVNFKTLQHFVFNKVKKIKAELF